MDSPPFAGFVLDPTKCSKLSMDEKRELVYEISKWSQGAPEMLQTWSRRELLQILCAEMGKERKYTGLTKYKMIEHLLRIVSERKSGSHTDGEDSASHPSPANTQTSSKRQRKTDHPSRVAIGTNHFASSNGDGDFDTMIYCLNVACRAAVHSEDLFCKRCSCCICFKYDDNKDPSLWLVCNSEPPNDGDSCGMSCHLECALKHERAGISKNVHHARLDGRFYCISCRKVNDLLGCWRKQLMIAKDARRVDVLCYRVSLSHRLLSGTTKFQKLHEVVDTAAKKLEAEVGSLDGLPTKMARGIVNRLSSGAEIQKLCALAVEMLDSMRSSVVHPSLGYNLQEASLLSPSIISFVDVSSTSLTVVLGSDDASSEDIVGYTLWHRKASSADYPSEPTCTLYRPNRRFFVSDLIPATEYLFKVVSCGNTRELGKWEVGFRTGSAMEDFKKNEVVASPKTNCSGPSNPSSEGDESNDAACEDPNNSPGSYSGYCNKSEILHAGKLVDYVHKEINHGAFGRKEVMGPEEIAGDSVSALDEEHITGEVGSEPNSTIQTESQRDSTNSTDDNQASDVPKSETKHPSEGQLLEELSIDNESNAPAGNEMEVVPYGRSDSVLPVTPCKVDIGKDGSSVRSSRMKTGEPDSRPAKPEEPLAGSSSKKRSAGRCEDTCNRDGSLERDYEYCVKVIRWLECEGHVQKNFRVKFLTWFSLQATPQERRIVSVYVDTLIDDPASLAGQLVDTFSEGIYRKRPPPVPSGFCMKLWH
ncbi:VIN3-like protein 2 [Magnolia sinica]|uniref:VIN3-like protein 2 n=1 Tax=Magnolia sinica TaxID=86752 RepID=UPI00265A0049|nr:VIN3-like protein 2 [Magnolia sinica]XP_058067960.1 VIN3-like protein 2 [Magnolia sinica]XP_058067961.1 VIN3-like protein 2 [Magnolia sinica]XP_058067962.1 VIN3-like protein 2 [Magnolia sinica]